MMIKLKTILTEGFAWERKEGKGLPTMAEVKAEYDAKQLKENAGDLFDEIADELGLTPEEFDEALNKSRAELDVIERLYNSDSLTSTEALGEIADMLDIPFGYYKNESANANPMGGSYDSMSDRQLIAAAELAGMEDMIIMGSDGLVNHEELIDLLNAEDQAKEQEDRNMEYDDTNGGHNGRRWADRNKNSNKQESAKPDFLDLDGDGNEKESMKSAANEAVGQEDADTRWNDPIQMGMRDISKPTTTSSIKAPSNFYREKLVSLKAQRKQIEFDMEQEAEPEGGPVADYYGDALQRVDGQIDMIMQKIRTNESMNEGFVSRLKKNLIGAELRK
jgi:hypothetical protein